MRSNSAWLNRDFWVCRNHLPVVRYRAGTQKCWYHGCQSVRPSENARPEKIEEPVAPPPPPEPEPEQEMCAWKDCGKPARPGSKYCSRNCSNKNARYRHRLRKRSDDEDDEDEAEAIA
ncbi:MAG: hypothetical protein H6739_31155 [Alphaproteobacteria bacterium]|nr:hypothetical protein [Alphaproteobacteria bacterium]